MKKKITILLAVLVLLTAFAGCGKKALTEDFLLNSKWKLKEYRTKDSTLSVPEDMTAFLEFPKDNMATIYSLSTGEVSFFTWKIEGSNVIELTHDASGTVIKYTFKNNELTTETADLDTNETRTEVMIKQD